MQRFARSLGRFSWAISLFSLGHCTEILKPSNSPGSASCRRAAATTLDTATGNLEAHLDENLRSVFTIGDLVLGNALNFAFRALPFSGKASCETEGSDPAASSETASEELLEWESWPLHPHTNNPRPPFS